MAATPTPAAASAQGAFWSVPVDALFAALGTGPDGIGADEAAARLARVGPNLLGERRRSDAPTLLLRQFTSPIVLLLAGAALLSFALHDPTDGVIILAIVAVSGLLGFWQERGAALAVETLLATVELKATVRRDGRTTTCPVRELVPGDVVLLAAGSGIPADCRLLEERDLFVNEAALTGESYPVDKTPGLQPPDAALAARDSALFLGSHVVSGTGRAVVVHTGRATELGAIAARLRVRAPETEFEHGVRRFGYLLMEMTLLLVIAIFACNVWLARPVLDSFLFALALAVGLTPQLLPAIISVNLARGAHRMAARHVIVKRLAAIENFGSMTVLCSDKTGTLTEGCVRLHAALDVAGRASDRVRTLACVNAAFETAFGNPIDDALRAEPGIDLAAWRKLAEVPYDFDRKRLSVLAAHGDATVLVTKGALRNVLDVCTAAETTDGTAVPIASVRAAIDRLYAELSDQGFRTLGVATRTMPGAQEIDRASERAMTFAGVVAFADPPRADVAATIAALRALGVRLKVVTGDNGRVAARVASAVGLADARIVTGPELRQISDDALPQRAAATDVFAEIEPNQKERIIRALRRSGAVVGYIGDGINDAPALHAADVSISVQGAVDVAKEAADIVLLEPDLAVLAAGVREGRRTFANTLKYVFMATSANFGNMFSMAGASLVLPFLPLLPKQILLTNLLTDLPELTIATDRVDADWIARPHRWDLAFVRRFMIVFGLVSSLFDYVTFAVLLFGLHAGPAEFRTGWFVESVVSATAIVLVVRTRGSFLRAAPAPGLLAAVVLVVVAAVLVPYGPLAAPFGFVPLPASFLAAMGGIVLAYVATAELAKRRFYARR